MAREGAKFIIEGKWSGERRRLIDRETLLALTGEGPDEVRQPRDIFERHYKYRGKALSCHFRAGPVPLRAAAGHDGRASRSRARRSCSPTSVARSTPSIGDLHPRGVRPLPGVHARGARGLPRSTSPSSTSGPARSTTLRRREPLRRFNVKIEEDAFSSRSRRVGWSNFVECRKTLDVEKVRSDFPILKRKVNGKRLVYLDNAATTQKPKVVIDATGRLLLETQRQPHRGVHQLSIEATETYESSRKKVATFINSPSRGGGLHEGYDRVDKPREVRLGAQPRQEGRRHRPHDDGAPQQHGPVAAPREGGRARG